jgi:chorismate dehydratase
MEPVRVAAVRYLNTAPLIEGLEKWSELRLETAVPSAIAPMVLDGRADVGLASVVDAASGELSLVPAGMIGCDGATMTVRLFSAVPMDRVTTLHADTDSHTSVVLARVLLARRFGVRPSVVDFDARERVPRNEPKDRAGAPRASPALEEAWPETLLLIGDKVVTDSPPAVRYPHQLDLGEAWKEWTGLPFVYAMWVCRGAEAGSERVRLASAALDRQRRHNRTRLDWIIATRAPQAHWPLDLARRYVGELLRYDVGEREREAVGRFWAEARGLGLLPEGPAPRFAE